MLYDILSRAREIVVINQPSVRTYIRHEDEGETPVFGPGIVTLNKGYSRGK
jgi:hypothetical protein